MIAKETAKKVASGVETEVVKVAESALNKVEKVAHGTGKGFEKVIKPLRENILKRFPTLFLLLVTFGFTAVVTGMEQLLVQYQVLQEHPALIFWIGISILVITGRTYKRFS